MEYMARKDLGMESEKFYLLTWYDWCLWIERINELQRQQHHNQEVIMDLGRRLLSQYWNWNRGNNAAATPQDFWKLSWDREQTDTQVKPEDQEKIKGTIERLERIAQKRIKGKRGG